MAKYLMVLIFFYAIDCKSQSIFQKTIGSANDEWGQAISRTLDNGYIVAGVSKDSAGLLDAYVIKTDSEANIQWTKTFGTTNNEFAFDIDQTSDTGYIVAGGVIDGGYQDISLIRLNSNGDTLWTKFFDEDEFDNAFSVHETTDGGFVLTGQTLDTVSEFSFAFVMKTDMDGNLMWSNILYGPTFYSTGRCVNETADSGFIYAGNSLGYAVLIRFDGSGNTIWNRTLSGPYSLNLEDVVQTDDGGFIATGSYQPGMNNYDLLLIRTDSNGDTLWTAAYGGPNNENGHQVLQLDDGGFIVAGVTTSYGPGIQNAYVVRTDSNGQLLWSQTYGQQSTNQNASGIVEDGQGGFMIIGGGSGLGGSDVFYIRTDSLGLSGCNEMQVTTATYSPALSEVHQSIQLNPGMSQKYIQLTEGSIGNPMIHCYSGLSTVIANTSSTVFPNPFDNHITIDCLSKVSMKLYSATGQMIIQQNLEVGQNKIILDMLHAGFYLLQINNGDAVFYSKLLKN